jgi:DNA-binding NtrC family response regulator
MNGHRPATIVVLHEHLGVLELVETALRDQGARVFATRDSFEALETVRRLKVDLVLLSRAKTDVARDLRVFQPELSAVVLGNEPMWLAEIEAAVLAALAERGERA